MSGDVNWIAHTGTEDGWHSTRIGCALIQVACSWWHGWTEMSEEGHFRSESDAKAYAVELLALKRKHGMISYLTGGEI